MSSPIFAFFSSPISPPQTPASTSRPTTANSDSYWESNVTLFTHQDGKKFQVSIVRLDEHVDVDSDNLGHREEDWDSDDWDEDAEDLEEPVPQPYFPQPQHSHARLHRTSVIEEDNSRQQDHRTVDDWDGDAQDLEEEEEEEEQPVAKWGERPDRPGWVRRQRDADVWRTRLGD